MQSTSSFQDAAVDKAYRNAGFARSPAHALADAMGIYVILGKVIGLVCLLLYLFGVDLYSNVIIIALTAVSAQATYALGLNATVSSLVPVTMSNAIHVGEMVALSRPGRDPAHNPFDFVTGFVEGFTWNHIVIRDFKKFQVFIPYHEFQSLVITNWSRRQAKLVNIELRVQPSLSGGAARLAKMCDFIKEWIQRHPLVDTEQYNRCIILYEDHAPVLRIVLYNKIRTDRDRLRNELVVALMDAAEKLNLCLMPVEQRPRHNWPPSSSSSEKSQKKNDNEDGTEQEETKQQEQHDPYDPSLSDIYHLFHLLSSSELTARSGYAAAGSKVKTT